MQKQTKIGVIMIEIITLSDGFFSTNTYIVFNKENKDAVIIDAGSSFDFVNKQIQSKNLNIHALLLTHGHFDHIMSAKAVQNSGIKVYVHKNDALKLKENKYSFLMLDFPTLEPDVLIDEGELKLGSLMIKIIHTPGHSKGSVCYMIGGALFTGDTLFKLSVGRSDFADGSQKDLANSIKNKLFSRDKDYKIYPGHGQSTTLFFEKENNPYFKSFKNL